MTPPRENPSGPADVAGQPEQLDDPPILTELLQLDPEKVPQAVGSLLAVFRQPVESYDDLGEDAISPQVFRAIVTELVERRQTEREVFLAALGAYKDLTERLTQEATDARSEISAQAHAAQLDRAQLLQEFLDRLDVLSAKISTSAARYSNELEDKDRLLSDEELRVLAYAGQAATAQSVIDDIHRSSSWRLTAPLRLMSRLAARRRPAPEI